MTPPYVIHSDEILSPGKPILSSTVMEQRDNLISVAQGGAGAPIVQAGWHPYDMATVGDNSQGLLYNNDGTVPVVSASGLTGNYEYKLAVRDLKAVSGASSQNLIFQVYENLTWKTVAETTTNPVSASLSFSCCGEFSKQGSVSLPTYTKAMPSDQFTFTVPAGGYNYTAVRVKLETSSIGTGTVWLYKRGSY